MKTTILKIMYVFMALVIALSFSCSPEDGTDGANGANGTNGTVGADGNANVQTFTFDISSKTGNIFSVQVPQFTQDVLDNDGILIYLHKNFSYYQVPGTSDSDEIKVLFFLQTIRLLFYDRLTGDDKIIEAGVYDFLKLVIIKSSGTATLKSTTAKANKQAVFNELEQAGVDVLDYQAVANYYGLD